MADTHGKVFNAVAGMDDAWFRATASRSAAVFHVDYVLFVVVDSDLDHELHVRIRPAGRLVCQVARREAPFCILPPLQRLISAAHQVVGRSARLHVEQGSLTMRNNLETAIPELFLRLVAERAAGQGTAHLGTRERRKGGL